MRPQLYEHAIAAREGTVVQGGPFCAETGVHTGRSPKDKHTVVDAATENTVWWDGNRKLSQANFQLLYEDFIAHARGKTLFAQDLYGGADPDHRIKVRVFTELGLALAVHPPVADPARAPRACELRAGIHHRRPAELQGRPEAPRHPHRHGCRHRLHPQDHPDRQLVLRGRDEEVGVHAAQLLPAGEGRDADALLGQRRQEWRRRAVLRPLRHRQDDALGRSRTAR